MRFPELTTGNFIKRQNRFTATIRLTSGGETTAYVPSTGRLPVALNPGCRAWFAPAKNSNRKTPYTLVLTELENGGLCSINAVLANQLFNEALLDGRLAAFACDTIQKEVTFGQSRLDFRLSSSKGVCWVEVKSVTYATNGVGMFPDAPTMRGRKHLGELAKLTARGERASVVFVAQREDARRFTPDKAIDPNFADELRLAHHKGVEVHAYRCDVSTQGIEIAEEIPVDLPE